MAERPPKDKDDEFAQAPLAGDEADAGPEPYEDEGGKINPFEDPDYVFEDEKAAAVAGWKEWAGALGALALLIAFHGLQLAHWNARETRPPAWDQAIQLEIAHDYHRAFRAWDMGTLFTLAPKPGMPPFPPLYHLALQYAMDEPDPVAAARWANWGFMALLCVSLWGLARRAAGPWAGAAAAILFSCAPEVQWLFRETLMDLALAALTAAAYWALLASERFERRRPAAAFGVLFGLAMLTKWSAWTYFLPVFWFASEAANEPQRLRNFLRAAGIALALCAPWYLVQWTVLVPRLFGAAADNAVPITTVAGLFAYFHQMSVGLETPFFLVAFFSLLNASASKTARREAGPLLAWFFTSLVFWMLVPNRQLRYLLPGLAPLAVLTAATAGRRLLIGLCALQVLAAANYGNAWIAPKRASLGLALSLFRADAPKREDWRLAEILRKADELRDKSRPFANLALLANHPQFNGASFNWEVDRLGLDGIRMRGINRRICEFAEFLLMKTDDLGPPEVTGQLPKVRERLLISTSWFMRGYGEAGRWTLPDGSAAVLYRRRPMPPGVFPPGAASFDFYEDKDLKAEGLVIDLGPFDRARGVYPKVRVKARTVSIRGLDLRGLDAEFEDLQFVTVEDPEDRTPSARQELLLDVRLLGMKRLTLRSLSADAESIVALAKARVKGLRSARLELEDGISAGADWRGLKLAAEAEAALTPEALELSLRRLRVGGVPVPTWLLGPQRGYRLDFAPDPELPFELAIPSLELRGGKLTIGPK